jgi:hypothetical protein
VEHDPLCLTRYPYHRPCNCEYVAMVRADERERVKAEYVPVLMEHLRRETEFTGLRAKVEALPGNDPYQSPERRAAYEYAIESVLDLIDGSSSDV